MQGWRSERSASVAPVAWASLQVGDCDNHDLSTPKSVHNLIRKRVHQCAPGQTVPRHRSAEFRVGLNAEEGRGNRVKEVATKAGPLHLVSADGFCQFVRGRLGRTLSAGSSERSSVGDRPHSPGFESDRTGLDRDDSALDFRGPRVFGTWVRRTVEAAEKLGGKFGSSLEIEAQRIREDGLSGLGHDSDCTPIHDAQQELQRTPAWGRSAGAAET